MHFSATQTTSHSVFSSILCCPNLQIKQTTHLSVPSALILTLQPTVYNSRVVFWHALFRQLDNKSTYCESQQLPQLFFCSLLSETPRSNNKETTHCLSWQLNFNFSTPYFTTIGSMLMCYLDQKSLLLDITAVVFFCSLLPKQTDQTTNKQDTYLSCCL